MGWGGNLPEFSRVASKEESFLVVGRRDRQKGGGEESLKLGGLFASPFLVGGGAHYPLESRFRLATALEATSRRTSVDAAKHSVRGHPVKKIGIRFQRC